PHGARRPHPQPAARAGLDRPPRPARARGRHLPGAMGGPAAMTPRDRILARIRVAALGGAGMPPPLVPSLATPSGEAAVRQFIEKAERVDATVSRLASMDEVPAALADELRRRNLPAAIRTGEDPAFARDWSGPWGVIEHSTGPGR